MVSANESTRHVVHGRPARLRVRRGVPRSHGGDEHATRSATRPEPDLLSEFAGVEANHVNGLATTTPLRPPTSWPAATRPTTARIRRPTIRRTSSSTSSPIAFPPTSSEAGSTSSRTASPSTSRSCRTPGRPQRDRADAVGAAHDRALSVIDGPWEHLNGSSVNVDPLEEWFDTWLKGERPDGPDADAVALLRPRKRAVRRDLGVSVRQRNPDPPVLRPRRHAHRLRSARRRRIEPLPGHTSHGLPPGRTPSPNLPTAGALTHSRPATATATRSSGARAARPAAGRSISGRWAASRSRPGPPDCSRLAPATTGAQAGPWAITYTSGSFPHDDTWRDRSPPPFMQLHHAETEFVAEIEDVTPTEPPIPLTEGALLGSLRAVEQSPVLDSRRHDAAPVSPVHAGLGERGHARCRHRV